MALSYRIGHYKSSVRIVTLASHTIYVVCFNFIHERRESLQLNVDSERQICEEFDFEVFARNLLRGSRRRSIISHFVLMYDLEFEPRLYIVECALVNSPSPRN